MSSLRVLPVIAAAMAFLATNAAADGPLSDSFRALQDGVHGSPSGPILASNGSLVLSNGSVIPIERVAADVSGKWFTPIVDYSADIFRLPADMAPLPSGQPFCGSDQVARYMTALTVPLMQTTEVVILTFYRGEDAPSASDPTKGHCATYSYTALKAQGEPSAAGTPSAVTDEQEGGATRSAGNWSVSRSVDPIDDSKAIILSLSPSNVTGGGLAEPALIARCRKNKTDLYIAWDKFLGSDGKNVTIRLDRKKAVTEKWSNSTDDKASFSPSAIPLLKELVKAETLTAQVTPYREGNMTVTFDLAGLDAHLPELAETCKWKL